MVDVHRPPMTPRARHGSLAGWSVRPGLPLVAG